MDTRADPPQGIVDTQQWAAQPTGQVELRVGPIFELLRAGHCVAVHYTTPQERRRITVMMRRRASYWGWRLECREAPGQIAYRRAQEDA